VHKKRRFKTKVLTTTLPFSGPSGQALKRNLSFPSHLLINTSFGLFANSDEEQEQLWLKTIMWSSNNDGMKGILKFLKEQGKSAYGTFELPDKTDGFFVIPYDQPEDMSEGVLRCKYVLGLGVLNDDDDENKRVM